MYDRYIAKLPSEERLKLADNITSLSLTLSWGCGFPVWEVKRLWQISVDCSYEWYSAFAAFIEELLSGWKIFENIKWLSGKQSQKQSYSRWSKQDVFGVIWQILASIAIRGFFSYQYKMKDISSQFGDIILRSISHFLEIFTWIKINHGCQQRKASPFADLLKSPRKFTTAVVPRATGAWQNILEKSAQWRFRQAKWPRSFYFQLFASRQMVWYFLSWFW